MSYRSIARPRAVIPEVADRRSDFWYQHQALPAIEITSNRSFLDAVLNVGRYSPLASVLRRSQCCWLSFPTSSFLTHRWAWVDAWYYMGFAQRLPEKLARYHALYQSERIAWTLPAYVFNRVAPPLVANYIVKGVFFLATTFFLFGSVREITGSLRTAAFVSGLAAFHSFLVHSLGTSYVDGPMNTYVLGTIYFGTRAFLRTTRVGSAFLAGAFVGCQLFTHPSVTGVDSLVCDLLPDDMDASSRARSQPAARYRYAKLGTVSVLVGAIALSTHWGPDAFPLRNRSGSSSSNPPTRGLIRRMAHGCNTRSGCCCQQQWWRGS